MSNRQDIQFTFNPHNKATILDCAFTVAPTDTAGLGISSATVTSGTTLAALNQGGRIQSVYMKTSATKAQGSPGGTTGPAAGLIVVNLQDNYNAFLAVSPTIISPTSGSSLLVASAGLTVGNAYQITVMGTTTAAQWVVLGVPANITPALGVSFIAAATSCTGTGAVQATVTSGIDHIEVVGLPDTMTSNGAYVLGAGQGQQLILACYSQGTLTAPVAGSRIRLKFYMNNTAQGI